jgi:VWFA-related protein
MKKFAVIFIWLGLLAISLAAQTQRTTRARVVTTPTPAAPPTLQTDTPTQPTAKRPPVLIGDTKSDNQTQTNNQTPETAAEDDGEIIKVETNLVTMPVSVLDRSGRFIPGLKQKDFHIFENNMEQKIEYFASVEQPFTVVLLIDVSPSTAFRIEEIHEAAISFVNQLRRDDKVAVISFDQRVRVLSPPTNDRNALRNAISQAAFGSGTSLYEAIDYTIREQLQRIEGRKAVVLFTDGVDTTSRRASYQSTVSETEEIDALFYPIRYDTYQDMQARGGGGGGSNYPSSQGPTGNVIADIFGGIFGGNIQIGGNQRGGYPGRGGGSAGSGRAAYETGRRYLDEISRNSGGRLFEANNNLDVAFTGFAEELRRQYTIGYYPETVGQKGERKQIRVRVQRPDVVVRAKTSYVVGKVAGR